MPRRLWPYASLLAVCGLATTAVTFINAPVLAQQATPAGASQSPRDAVLERYCVTCHNAKLRTAGLAFDTPEMADVALRADVWEKVLQKLRMGAMPPSGSRQPDTPAVGAFVSWLQDELDRAADSHPNPGRTGSVHRLNRSEYRNAVRDVLGLDIDVDSHPPG